MFEKTIDFVEVFDLTSKQPIPYVSIYLIKGKSGGYTNERGIFLFPSNFVLKNDSIMISSVGYATQVISTESLDKPIYLKPITINLDEVIVNSNAKEVLLGAISRETKFVTSIDESKNSENEIALLIPNKNKLEGQILSVGYYISNGGRPKTPFRVRLYGVDKNFKPTTDILNESVIISGNSKGGWLEIDLKKYKISYPSDGFFISMEWLYGIKKTSFYKLNNITNAKTEINYGQNLGLTNELIKPVSYQRRFSDRWETFKVTYPKYISEKDFYPMMQARIKIYD